MGVVAPVALLAQGQGYSCIVGDELDIQWFSFANYSMEMKKTE